MLFLGQVCADLVREWSPRNDDALLFRWFNQLGRYPAPPPASRTDKPIAVITNGALLYEKSVREELLLSDIVLPTLDAYDEEIFKKINRPHGSISYKKVLDGLIKFSKQFKGKLWLEMMFIKGYNNDLTSILKYKELLAKINYDKLYLNTPIRPPAESFVEALPNKNMKEIEELLGGISIDLLDSEGFFSDISDHIEAILSIIKRHPMNQYEIKGFLNTRNCVNIEEVILKLKQDSRVEVINYKGYYTFRLK